MKKLILSAFTLLFLPGIAQVGLAQDVTTVIENFYPDDGESIDEQENVLCGMTATITNDEQTLWVEVKVEIQLYKFDPFLNQNVLVGLDPVRNPLLPSSRVLAVDETATIQKGGWLKKASPGDYTAVGTVKKRFNSGSWTTEHSDAHAFTMIDL